MQAVVSIVREHFHWFQVTLAAPDAVASRRLHRNQVRELIHQVRRDGKITVGTLTADVKLSVAEQLEGCMRETCES
jgi:hypothetical protein